MAAAFAVEEFGAMGENGGIGVVSPGFHETVCYDQLFVSDSASLPNLPALSFRINRPSMENLWLKSIKEARDIASDGNRTENRRAGPGRHPQGNQKDFADPRG